MAIFHPCAHVYYLFGPLKYVYMSTVSDGFQFVCLVICTNDFHLFFFCTLQMRFITKSRFSNLWSKQFLPLFMLFLSVFLQSLELCNAIHFIDPYLEDIRSIRDFQPRKLYNQFLEPRESKLTRWSPLKIRISYP